MFGVEAKEEGADEELPEPYYATVTVRGQDIKFEISSVATASVISEETYKQTSRPDLPSIHPSNRKLRTNTGQPIPHLGVQYVDMAAEGQRARARLMISKGCGPSLLGSDWLRKIRLNCHAVKYAHMTFTTETIPQRYSDVFRDVLGTLKGVTVKLNVDPEATPRFLEPRPEPYAMKGTGEEELEHLQWLGIIDLVQYS